MINLIEQEFKCHPGTGVEEERSVNLGLFRNQLLSLEADGNVTISLGDMLVDAYLASIAPEHALRMMLACQERFKAGCKYDPFLVDLEEDMDGEALAIFRGRRTLHETLTLLVFDKIKKGGMYD